MLKKIIAALVMTFVLSACLTTMGGTHKAEAATYHTKAIAVAKSNLGVRYLWGGTSRYGYDCSGLVYVSYRAAGKTLPRTAGEMALKGTTVSASSLRAGDLLFYNTGSTRGKVTHVAIYIGAGKMIHSSSSRGVSIISTSNSYWKPKFIRAKRI